MNLDESSFRNIVQKTLDRVERAFSNIDPDIAECEQSLGAMTITLADGSRCILSTQPSVRQLWLAIAARGTAYHFSYDQAKSRWLDDKGRGIELIGFLEGYFKETVSDDFAIGG